MFGGKAKCDRDVEIRERSARRVEPAESVVAELSAELGRADKCLTLGRFSHFYHLIGAVSGTRAWSQRKAARDMATRDQPAPSGA